MAFWLVGSMDNTNNELKGQKSMYTEGDSGIRTRDLHQFQVSTLAAEGACSSRRCHDASTPNPRVPPDLLKAYKLGFSVSQFLAILYAYRVFECVMLR